MAKSQQSVVMDKLSSSVKGSTMEGSICRHIKMLVTPSHGNLTVQRNLMRNKQF